MIHCLQRNKGEKNGKIQKTKRGTLSNGNFKKIKLKHYLCLIQQSLTSIYLLKVNKRNTRTRCEKYSKFTIKTPNDVIGVFLVYLLLTLNILHTLLYVFYCYLWTCHCRLLGYYLHFTLFHRKISSSLIHMKLSFQRFSLLNPFNLF